VQLGAKNEFIGTILWDTVDVLTFGALEKKKNRTKGNDTLIEGAYGPVNSNSSSNISLSERRAMQNLIDERKREQERLDELRRLRARELQLTSGGQGS
jgi:hypothetical protein